jgi:hypothetical protein
MAPVLILASFASTGALPRTMEDNRTIGIQRVAKSMRRVGFEPTHPFGQGLLRAPRLPFRHRRTGAHEV